MFPVGVALKLFSVSNTLTTFDLSSDVFVIYLAEDLLLFQNLFVLVSFLRCDKIFLRGKGDSLSL